MLGEHPSVERAATNEEWTLMRGPMTLNCLHVCGPPVPDGVASMIPDGGRFAAAVRRSYGSVGACRRAAMAVRCLYDKP